MMILGKTLFSMSIQNLELFSTMLIGYFAYWGTQTLEEVEEQELSDPLIESNQL